MLKSRVLAYSQLKNYKIKWHLIHKNHSHILRNVRVPYLAISFENIPNNVKILGFVFSLIFPQNIFMWEDGYVTFSQH